MNDCISDIRDCTHTVELCLLTNSFNQPYPEASVTFCFCLPNNLLQNISVSARKTATKLAIMSDINY